MKKRTLAFTSGIANTFEWYDYALFGHLAPIIGQQFFPHSNPNAALLQVFLVFAVGYLMRPIGGIFFGIIGDKLGRRESLSLAMICTAVPTVAIAFLPNYKSWGIFATVIMIILRMIQGLSMGGALTGSISYIIEHTDKNQRGLYGSISMSSLCLGILMGSIVTYSIKIIFSLEQLNTWAWRLPFVIGIGVFFAGIYIKKYTQETPIFKDIQSNDQLVTSPLRTVVKHYWFHIIISILINATGSVIFYFESIYLVSYLKINRGFAEYNVGILMNTCYIIMIFATLCAGYFSDKMVRNKIFILNLISIIILFPIIAQIISSANFTHVVVAQIILAIMTAFYIGPEPALQAEFYPTNIRNTGLAISYNMATSVFGGTTPYVVESLVQNSGTITSTIYYVIICAFLGLFALYFYQDNSNTIHQ